MSQVITSASTNPTFYLNATSFGISFGETAAYILALGNKVDGTVRRDFVEYFFGKAPLHLFLLRIS